MIEIVREGTKLVVKITVWIPTLGERVYPCTWECGTEEYAGFLADAISLRMGNKLQAIRQEAYNKGWKEAKAKKGGRYSWFSRAWK
jgi:hypothetical protein